MTAPQSPAMSATRPTAGDRADRIRLKYDLSVDAAHYIVIDIKEAERAARDAALVEATDFLARNGYPALATDLVRALLPLSKSTPATTAPRAAEEEIPLMDDTEAWNQYRDRRMVRIEEKAAKLDARIEKLESYAPFSVREWKAVLGSIEERLRKLEGEFRRRSP